MWAAEFKCNNHLSRYLSTEMYKAVAMNGRTFSGKRIGSVQCLWS